MGASVSAADVKLIEGGKESCCGGAIREQAIDSTDMRLLRIDVADDYRKSAESLPIKLFTTSEERR